MRRKIGWAPVRRWIAERRSSRDLRALLASLDGKSVAIVGNATSLLAHRHGALIDGHDIVVRMNMVFPVDPAAQGMAGFKRIKSGSLELERSDAQASASMGSWGPSSFGAQLYPMLKACVAGPRVTGTGTWPVYTAGYPYGLA